jgi:hypothetical protein
MKLTISMAVLALLGNSQALRFVDGEYAVDDALTQKSVEILQNEEDAGFAKKT